MTATRRPLLITPNFSYSGAPIALLALARALARLGHPPVVTSIGDGPLKSDFIDAGIEVTRRLDPAGVSFVLGNTVLAMPATLFFTRLGIPTAAWIHESTVSLSQLRMPVDTLGLDKLDLVLAPARFQREQLGPYAKPDRVRLLRSPVTQEHYRLPCDEPYVAVSGMWEARKGQARLLALAREAGVQCRFTFIGAEAPSDRAALDPDHSHRFLGPVPPQTARRTIAMASALVSCATEEVLNLAALEALMAGRPALLSDIPAHQTLARRIDNVLLFDPASAASFRSGWQALALRVADETRARLASQQAHTEFGEHAFQQRVQKLALLLLRP